MRHCYCVAFLLSLTLGSGCGGGEGDAIAVPEQDPVDTGPLQPPDCSLSQGLELLTIDDFELGAAKSAFSNNEVCGPCNALDAGSSELLECQERCRASQFPTDLDKPLPAERIPGGRCGSSYALHITSQSFYQWGGLVGFPFSPAFDASDFDGVAFWARVRWSTRNTVRTVALDPETDATFVRPDTGAGYCDGQATLDDTDRRTACDPFGSYSILSGNWRFVKVPFEEMRQRGFGHVVSALDRENVRRIGIEYATGAWDLWIDDVSFYREQGAAR